MRLRSQTASERAQLEALQEFAWRAHHQAAREHEQASEREVTDEGGSSGDGWRAADQPNTPTMALTRQSSGDQVPAFDTGIPHWGEEPVQRTAHGSDSSDSEVALRRSTEAAWPRARAASLLSRRGPDACRLVDYLSPGETATGNDTGEDTLYVKVVDSEDEREWTRKRRVARELRLGQRHHRRRDEIPPSVLTEGRFAGETTPTKLHERPLTSSDFTIFPHSNTPHKRRLAGVSDESAESWSVLLAGTRKQLRPRSTSNAARRVTIESLPGDVLFHVFRQLDWMPDLALTATRVCRQWRASALDERLWREMDFCGYERVPSAVVVELSRRANGTLRSIDLSKCHQVSNEAIVAVARENAGLECVRLSWCTQVDDEVVQEVARSCPRLREIVLSFCGNITSKSVEALASHCPRLTAVNLACVGKVELSALTKLARCCPNIRRLQIVNSLLVDDAAVIHLAKRLPHLTHLDLSWCYNVSDESLFCLARHCKHLTWVELGDTKVSARGIHALLSACPRILHLNFARCVLVDDAAITAILTHAAHRLEGLNIASCHRISDDAVKNLLTKCAALKTLDVSKLPCRRLGDALRRVGSRVEVFY
ncbi:hypothetical protein CDCA_CDCA01G0269 [Cyanidium caldarium]|uniref:F-box domain-containing protein n=1 Tax=Cyanidium caldarium TaxID=2771 RepID=A0AAV9IQ07_CYACA|nr:hypothetical protein CDCA_CDCA01G0269 [Cyanidium caldarium]